MTESNPLHLLGQNFFNLNFGLTGWGKFKIHDNLFDPDETEYYIVSQNREWEMILSSDYLINTIFLYLCNGHHGLPEFRKNKEKKNVTSLFGQYNTVYGNFRDPASGDKKTWTRHAYQDAIIHFQYSYTGKIEVITLMSSSCIKDEEYLNAD